MPESHTENELATWTVDECAFTIEYSLRALDDIRLAVVDAFFSLPRGGAEIGGILLGTHSSRVVTISDYLPLDCEHATGPSFVLSPRDHDKLAHMLAAARGNPGGLEPVGWYHSHTRSEINLTPADIEIHNRYFPERWQVAVVLKPHTFHPCRAGFFFRERDGSIHSSGSYQEVALDPLSVRPLPEARSSPEARPAREPRSETEVHSTPIPAPPLPKRAPEPAPLVIPPVPTPSRPDPEARTTIERTRLPERPTLDDLPLPEPKSAAKSVPEPEPVAEPVAEPTVPPPAFTEAAPAKSWGTFGVLLALAAGLAFGAAAYQTRELWLPHGSAASNSNPSSIGLTILDVGGQLQIRWNRESPAVRSADEGSLVIEDGSALPQAVQLNSTHLRQGSFTYGRQSERVDVALTLHGPDSQTVREMATFLGKLPTAQSLVPSVEDPTARKEANQLRNKNKKLEKTVDELRQELRKRSRLANQSPDSVK
ncbi:MAG TPA: hypothetical protein VKU19_17795 [Bryobacteraceae bacterium]|nr:hypothetical protein [Bryobacteraceae bacterium]